MAETETNRDIISIAVVPSKQKVSVQLKLKHNCYRANETGAHQGRADETGAHQDGADATGAGALQGGAGTHGRDWDLEETETQEAERAHIVPRIESGSLSGHGRW